MQRVELLSIVDYKIGYYVMLLGYLAEFSFKKIQMTIKLKRAIINGVMLEIVVGGTL